MEKIKMDLNLDAGESSEALQSGFEESLYQLISSVNIACGGHAGDAFTMAKAVELAQKYDLKMGAHPSFPDRENFGRQIVRMPISALVDSLTLQMENLRTICHERGARLTHIKPHGALYNWAATDFSGSQAIIESVRRFDPSLFVVGLAGSKFLDWCREAGLKPVAEAFTDRRYEATGALRDRQLPDAMIEDSQQAGEQAVQIVCHRQVTAIGGARISIQADTLCIHGDSKQALETAKQVRSALLRAGVRIRSFLETDH